MSKKIVNLTLPVVSQKVDRILDTYPYCLYQKVLGESDLRLQLVAYVLNRVPNLHVVSQEERYSQTNLRLASSELLKIEALIEEAIHIILPKFMATPPEEFCQMLRQRQNRAGGSRSNEEDSETVPAACRWEELAAYAQVMKIQP